MHLVAKISPQALPSRPTVSQSKMLDLWHIAYDAFVQHAPYRTMWLFSRMRAGALSRHLHYFQHGILGAHPICAMQPQTREVRPHVKA